MECRVHCVDIQIQKMFTAFLCLDVARIDLNEGICLNQYTLNVIQMQKMQTSFANSVKNEEKKGGGIDGETAGAVRETTPTQTRLEEDEDCVT